MVSTVVSIDSEGVDSNVDVLTVVGTDSERVCGTDVDVVLLIVVRTVSKVSFGGDSDDVCSEVTLGNIIFS